MATGVDNVDMIDMGYSGRSWTSPIGFVCALLGVRFLYWIAAVDGFMVGYGTKGKKYKKLVWRLRLG